MGIGERITVTMWGVAIALWGAASVLAWAWYWSGVLKRRKQNAMGFKRPTYHLQWDDGALSGLEIRCHGASVEQVVELSGLLAMGSDLMEPESIDKRNQFMTLLGDKLISWNIEDDDGTAVPATAEYLGKEDWSIVAAYARAFINAGIGVAAPLVQSSSNGVPSGVESIPMEILSESPMN